MLFNFLQTLVQNKYIYLSYRKQPVSVDHQNVLLIRNIVINPSILVVLSSFATVDITLLPTKHRVQNVVQGVGPTKSKHLPVKCVKPVNITMKTQDHHV
jgi:hypothetical protein